MLTIIPIPEAATLSNTQIKWWLHDMIPRQSGRAHRFFLCMRDTVSFTSFTVLSQIDSLWSIAAKVEHFWVLEMHYQSRM
jgi:hypothetical protein